LKLLFFEIQKILLIITHVGGDELLVFYEKEAGNVWNRNKKEREGKNILGEKDGQLGSSEPLKYFRF
jgi:hypothetical protein